MDRFLVIISSITILNMGSIFFIAYSFFKELGFSNELNEKIIEVLNEFNERIEESSKDTEFLEKQVKNIKKSLLNQVNKKK